jgi:ketosteroid isomerase-like protein
MKHLLSSVIVMLFLALGLQAQTTSADAAELTKLLHDFLAGASRNDVAVHDRFWAEDLIYTGSAGRRIGKADIMRDQRAASPPKSGNPTVRYTAEDVRIQQYGDTAIVAFRLVSTTEKDGKTQIANNLNTGTFLKRNGKWQAVAWQSTRMPRSEEESKKDVAAMDTALHQALLAADTKKLESIIDESFIWTHDNGEQRTHQQLLDQLRSGQLKYSKLEVSTVTVSIYGDTAVVRGASTRQRSAVPGSAGGDASPFPIFYTLTVVNKGGDWKAVAMHTSRP